MLEIEDLKVSYGGTVLALKGVTISVPTSGIVAVLGSNGAGKSTLMRAISGTLFFHKGRIDGGRVGLDGRDLTNRDPGKIVHSGVAQVPEGRRIFGRMTVEDNLVAGSMGASGRKGRAAAQQRVFDLFPILADRRGNRAAMLSGGEQQMLAIGRALMGSPSVLLLDEPSLGLAPKIVGQIGNIITEINRQGTSVMLVEQNATMALEVANEAYVLELGRVALSGTVEELSATDRMRRLYLGDDTDDNSSAALAHGAGSRSEEK